VALVVFVEAQFDFAALNVVFTAVEAILAECRRVSSVISGDFVTAHLRMSDQARRNYERRGRGCDSPVQWHFKK
jgi:hypothetical protein